MHDTCDPANPYALEKNRRLVCGGNDSPLKMSFLTKTFIARSISRILRSLHQPTLVFSVLSSCQFAVTFHHIRQKILNELLGKTEIFGSILKIYKNI